MSRSLPPFGIELRQWLQADPKPRRWGCNGNEPAITVALGADAWGWARGWQEKRLVLVVPPGEYAARFDWRLCSGHDPILIQLCGAVPAGAVEGLTCALMRDGVLRVLAVDTMDRFTAEGARDVAA